MRNILRLCQLGCMPHYYFDSRDGDDFVRDDVGLHFVNDEAARNAATLGLAEFALEVLPGSADRLLSIDVRDRDRHLFTAVIQFQISN